MMAENTIEYDLRSVTISLREEIRRREEIQAIRLELLALAREDEALKQKQQANKDKHLLLAQRLLALINN